MFGHPGTGKTHVVSALGHELVRQGYPVLFTPVSSLVERLLQAKRELRRGRELSKHDRAEAAHNRTRKKPSDGRLDEFLDDFPSVARDQAVALLERATAMVVSNTIEAAA